MRYGYSLIQKIIEKKNCSQSGVKVYMFHQVNDDLSQWLDPGISITEKSFYHFVEWHEEKGYEFLTVSELSDKVGEKKALFTFDDVFRDAAENAFPLLIRKKIPFCIFLSDVYLDAPGYITTSQLRELLDEPLCTIGFHSKSHKRMRMLTEEEKKIELDRTGLEKKIGRPIDFFAFPYGSVYACDGQSIELAKSMGYRYVFSTLKFECSQYVIGKVPFFLPRINVCEKNFNDLLRRIII